MESCRDVCKQPVGGRGVQFPEESGENQGGRS